ncbi:MAG: SDR family NAD(P)-dependent oxidoreductase [Pseudomonadota bacterium]
MAEKSVLITGCSSGIGYDAAHHMKRLGWRVFATCRKEEDCDRLMGEGLESFRLDYEDEPSIQAAVDEALGRTGGTLHAVFNNGAYAIPGLVEDLPTDALRAIFEANFFGYHTLARAAIPVMRAQGHGRIVQCSSILGFVTLRGRGAYQATKFALEGLTDTLRLELEKDPIHVVLIEPGPITSKIRENSAPHFEKWIDWKASHRARAYEKLMLPRLYAPASKDRFELPASAVSKTLEHALTVPRPRIRYRVTTPTHVMAGLKRILPTRWLDNVLNRM